MGPNRRFHVFDADKFLFCSGGHEGQPDEFAEEPGEVGIIRLGQPANFVFRKVVSEDPAQVLVDQRAAEWEQVVKQLAEPGHFGAPWLGAGNRRRAIAGMSEGNFERGNAVAVKDGLSFEVGFHLGSAVGVTPDVEVRRPDLAESCFAREKFAAGFFGGKASGEAGGAAGAFPGIGR